MKTLLALALTLWTAAPALAMRATPVSSPRGPYLPPLYGALPTVWQEPVSAALGALESREQLAALLPEATPGTVAGMLAAPESWSGLALTRLEEEGPLPAALTPAELFGALARGQEDLRRDLAANAERARSGEAPPHELWIAAHNLDQIQAYAAFLSEDERLELAASREAAATRFQRETGQPLLAGAAAVGRALGLAADPGALADAVNSSVRQVPTVSGLGRLEEQALEPSSTPAIERPLTLPEPNGGTPWWRRPLGALLDLARAGVQRLRYALLPGLYGGPDGMPATLADALRRRDAVTLANFPGQGILAHGQSVRLADAEWTAETQASRLLGRSVSPEDLAWGLSVPGPHRPLLAAAARAAASARWAGAVALLAAERSRAREGYPLPLPRLLEELARRMPRGPSEPGDAMGFAMAQGMLSELALTDMAERFYAELPARRRRAWVERVLARLDLDAGRLGEARFIPAFGRIRMSADPRFPFAHLPALLHEAMHAASRGMEADIRWLGASAVEAWARLRLGQASEQEPFRGATPFETALYYRSGLIKDPGAVPNWRAFRRRVASARVESPEDAEWDLASYFDGPRLGAYAFARYGEDAGAFLLRLYMEENGRMNFAQMEAAAQAYREALAAAGGRPSPLRRGRLQSRLAALARRGKLRGTDGYEAVSAEAARLRQAARGFGAPASGPLADLEVHRPAYGGVRMLRGGRRLKWLGSGQLGSVFLDERDPERVVKVIAPGVDALLLGGVNARSVAEEEIEVSRALSDSGLGPRLLAHGAVDGYTVLIKERVRGDTLEALFRERRYGEADHALVLDLMRMMAQKRLDFSDLKPQNLMIGTVNGGPRRAYVIDAAKEDVQEGERVARMRSRGSFGPRERAMVDALLARLGQPPLAEDDPRAENLMIGHTWRDREVRAYPVDGWGRIPFEAWPWIPQEELYGHLMGQYVLLSVRGNPMSGQEPTPILVRFDQMLQDGLARGRVTGRFARFWAGFVEVVSTTQLPNK